MTVITNRKVERGEEQWEYAGCGSCRLKIKFSSKQKLSHIPSDEISKDFTT